MAKLNSDNLRIKRKYLVWLREAKGLSDASIDKAAASIDRYEACLKRADFRAFHVEKARAFKRRLSAERNARTGAPLSGGTIEGTLRDVRAFFLWLADQTGYRSRISHADAEYLSPDRRSARLARGGCWIPHPSPEQVLHVLAQMPAETAFQRRDRAIVAFLFLTGSRDGAAISIRLHHVDLASSCVHFDGRTVSTKFGKSFTTTFFPVGDEPMRILADWIAELRLDHLWGLSDPLFPRTRVAVGPTGGFQAVGLDRAPWSTATQIAKLFKAAFSSVGLPPFSPHRIRNTLAEMARDFCRTPEEYKAWSQNLGHEDVLTTFMNYGSLAAGRQSEVMGFLARRGQLDREDERDVVKPL